MMSSKQTFGVVVAAVLTVIAVPAMALPTVDGRFDPAEGYTSEQSVVFQVQNLALPTTGGVLHTAIDPVTGDLFAHLALPTSLVDNTYGSNSIGWGADAPSGKSHKYKDLKGSDEADLVIYDGRGNVVLKFRLDYHEGSTPKPISVTYGPSNGVTAGTTSLDYNWNVLGYKLDQNSPAAHPQYDAFGNIDYGQPYTLDDPAYAGWLFEVAYEFRLSGSIFGNNGFGGLTGQYEQGDPLDGNVLSIFHVSPTKQGDNKTYYVPEPATLALLGLGGLPMLLRRKRK